MTPLRLSAGAFLLYAGASILWSPGDRLWATAFLVSLALSFLVGYIIDDPYWLWAGFAVLITIVFGVYAFEPFINRNILGCGIALAFAAALVFEFYWFVPLAFVGHLMTLSRGAILASSAALLIWLWPRSRLASIGCLVLGLMAIYFAGPSNDIIARLGIWQDTLSNLTVFGTGFDSFQAVYASWPTHIARAFIFAPHAYNDYLELVSDLGMGSLLFWLVVVFSIDNLRMAEGIILATFAVLSLTFFPLYTYPLGQLFAFTLGQSARR